MRPSSPSYERIMRPLLMLTLVLERYIAHYRTSPNGNTITGAICGFLIFAFFCNFRLNIMTCSVPRIV